MVSQDKSGVKRQRELLIDEILSGGAGLAPQHGDQNPSASSGHHGAPTTHAVGKTADRGRTLTPLEVAQTYYATPKPSGDQLRRIYARLKSGAIELNDPQAPPGRWTTTEASLARFLATRQAKQEAARHGVCVSREERSAISDTNTATSSMLLQRSDTVLRDIYTNAWRDYFAAVMFRRRLSKGSRTFERAVLAGQFMVVVIIAIMTMSAFKVFAPGTPHERRMVAAHLAAKHAWHEVDQWHAAHTDSSGRLLLRVQYRYRDGSIGKVVQTDRTYVVTAEGASELPSDAE
jgi:hypothetical protein